MQGRRSLAAAVAALAMLIVPASARAALSVTVTGDAGQPVALSTDAPLALRNMDVNVISNQDVAEGYRFSVAVLGPDNVPVSSGTTCARTEFSPENKEFVTYRGNGTYSVILRFYGQADTACATPSRELNYKFTIGAGGASGEPPRPGPTRPPRAGAPR